MSGHSQLRLAAMLLSGLLLAALLARALGPVVFEVDAELDRTPPGCIAVLPFETVVDNDRTLAGLAERVRRAMYADLSPRAARDIELVRVDATLRTLSRAQRRNHALVGGELGCDTLLIGTVTEYRERYLGLYSEVAVGAQIELVRAADGARLWEARHVATSRGGGLPISPLALVEGAVSAITNVGGEQLDRMADDLARRLVSALPAPTGGGSNVLAASGGDRHGAARPAAAPRPLTMPDGGSLI